MAEHKSNSFSLANTDAAEFFSTALLRQKRKVKVTDGNEGYVLSSKSQGVFDFENGRYVLVSMEDGQKPGTEKFTCLYYQNAAGGSFGDHGAAWGKGNPEKFMVEGVPLRELIGHLNDIKELPAVEGNRPEVAKGAIKYSETILGMALNETPRPPVSKYSKKVCSLGKT